VHAQQCPTGRSGSPPWKVRKHQNRTKRRREGETDKSGRAPLLLLTGDSIGRRVTRSASGAVAADGSSRVGGDAGHRGSELPADDGAPWTALDEAASGATAGTAVAVAVGVAAPVTGRKATPCAAQSIATTVGSVAAVVVVVAVYESAGVL